MNCRVAAETVLAALVERLIPLAPSSIAVRHEDGLLVISSASWFQKSGFVTVACGRADRRSGLELACLNALAAWQDCLIEDQKGPWPDGNPLALPHVETVGSTLYLGYRRDDREVLSLPPIRLTK